MTKKNNYNNDLMRWFKKKDDDNDNNGNDDGSNDGGKKGWSKLLQFLPTFRRAQFEKSYDSPQTDSSQRYMVRLLQAKSNQRRHVITRLLRFCPDLVFETAADIVDTALVDGISLVRVFNSERDAKYLVEMLKKADPPISAEVYDNKNGEILNA